MPEDATTTDRWERSVARYASSLLVVAGLGLALLWGGDWGGDWEFTSPVAEKAAALAVVSIASVLWQLRFHHGDGAAVGFNLMGGVHVALLLSTPAPVAVVTTVLATLVNQVYRRSARIKFAFNVGQDAAWAVGAAWVYTAIMKTPFEQFDTDRLLPAAAAILVALVVAELISNVAMAELVRRISGAPVLESLRHADLLGSTGLLVLASNVSAAVFLGVLASFSGWFVLLGVPPLAGLMLAYRGYVRQLSERERVEALQATSRRLVVGATAEGGLRDAVTQARDLFSAESSRLVLRDDLTEEDAADTLVANVLDTGRAQLRQSPPALAAPVVLDGHVRGAMVVSGRRGMDDWTMADLALLGTVAEEVASAMRTRELLAHLRQERRSLEAESNKLADIVGATSDGIVLLGSSGEVLSFNPAMEMLTGLRVEDVLERRWHEVLPLRNMRDVDLEPDGWSKVEQALRGESRLNAAQVQVCRTDGTWRRVRSSVSPVEDDDGEVRGVVLVLQDRTREEEVEQLRAEFVATVSHELRTPLTPLRGFLQTLESRLPDLSPEDMGQALSSMDTQLTRLETLIGDLLVVAEIQRGKGSVRPAPVPVAEAVEEAVAVELSAVEQLRLKRGALPPGLAVNADRAALVRIVRSLLSNGVKHTEGTVHVAAREGDGEVVIVVQDDGPGIGRWGRDKVFEPFGRLGDHLRRSAGPGLGLAIARSLAEDMGGRLDLVDGTPGACFELALPVHSVQPVQPATEPDQPTRWVDLDADGWRR